MKTFPGGGNPESPASSGSNDGSPGAPSRGREGEPLGPPRGGEWRGRFSERAQSFEEYVASAPNRPGSTRRFFCLQPLGSVAAVPSEILRMSRDGAEAYFGLPTRVLGALPPMDEAYIDVRRQFNSSMILDRLAPQVPQDALVYLAVTPGDLFGRGLRFVFGEGRLKTGVGVYSLARLATPDRALFLRRALRLMTHEAGHLLSLPHCTTCRCVMQGSNSLEESDLQPLHLCPVDLEKVAWNTGLDPRDRYLRLKAFYENCGLGPEAEWVAREIDRPPRGVHEMPVLEPGPGA